MIKLSEGILGIKNSNLVFFIEKKEDLSKISDLNLEKKVLDKIESIIKEKKSDFLEFFIWHKSYEKLYIFFYSKDKDINYFLWEKIKLLPNKFTILTNSEENVISLLNSVLLWRYKYDEFKSKREKDEIYFISDKKTDKLIKNRLKTIENIILARDLSSKPSNVLYPESFVDIIKDTKFKNVKVKIYNNKEIEKKWLNLISYVWKWSINKPYMVVFEKIIDSKNPTIWIICKWVTFDSWWIQVKPSDSMYEMKWDMSWAWTWFWLIKELDEKKLNVNIVMCLVLAENHISESSYRPSDIIKSYSWKTVDVINTDAEGRLILADWISYISNKYKTSKIITLATLTWACVVALWYRYVWIMWDDEDIIKKTLEYSENNVEKYWRLPFDNYYVEKTKWREADFENLNRRVLAWSTMWGAFLYNFLLNNEKFTHIDMAWAINSYEPYAYMNLWMTWFWVDSLSKIIQEL